VGVALHAGLKDSDRKPLYPLGETLHATCDSRASALFLLPCAKLLAGVLAGVLTLLLAACRGRLRGSQVKKKSVPDAVVPPSPDDGRASVVTVYVVTHQQSQEDLFWTTWKEGAEAADAPSKAVVEWRSVGYDLSLTLGALAEAGDKGDALGDWVTRVTLWVRKLVDTGLGGGASLLLGRAGMKKVRRFSPDANPERAPVCARSCTPPPVPLPPLSPRAHALCFPRIARDGGVGGGDGGAGSWPQRVGGER